MISSRKNVHRGLAVATAAILALALPACASDGGENNGEGDAMETLSLGLPGNPPVFLAMPAIVAHDAGIYHDNGVNVELRNFETGTDAAKAVAAGQIDASWSPSTVVLTMMSKDVPLVAIQGLEVIDWVITTSDDSIKTCADLAGTTINVDTVGGARYTAIQQMIASCGLDMDDLNTVSLPGKVGLEALIAGQINVAVLTTDELAFAGAEFNRTMPVVIRMADVVDNTHNMMLIVTKDTLEKKRDALARLVAGNLDAIDYLTAPDTRKLAVPSVAKGAGLTEERAALAIDAFLAIDYWPTDQGLTESKILGTIAAQEAVGNIDAGTAPAYGDIAILDLMTDVNALRK